MKTITLSRGKVAVVDDEDYDYLMQWKWCASFDFRGGGKIVIAVRHPKASEGFNNLETIYMHRQILSARKGTVVDHINHDTLDNRRSNLRECSDGENKCNRLRQKNISGFKGVSPGDKAGTWYVRIAKNKKQFCLGTFTNIVDAARKYDEAAKELHGEFALLNGI